MKPSSFMPASLLALLFAISLPLVNGNSFFQITQPAVGTQWQNGAANLVTWDKAVGDGIHVMDVEMSRLSQDGLIFVARDVPTGPGALNIFLQDVPAADDYFLIFLNSTHGVMYTTSPKFTIGSSANASATTDPNVATVTVSGGPNPTKAFATTFPPSENGVVMPGWKAVEGSMPQIVALMGVMAMCLVGGAWTVL